MTVATSSIPDQVPGGLFIGGRWRDATGGRTFAVEDPATGEAIRTVADAAPEDGAAALDAATRAQDAWGATAPRERGELLRRLFEAVTERTESFAQMITLEMGKSLAEARAEVAYGAEFLRWFSEEAVRIRGEYLRAPSGNGRILTVPRPVGPSLLITPWNFPLAMATRKIAPAMAAGCTTVIKPAAQAPLTTLLFAQLADEIGVPAGVVNVVTTTDAGGVMGPLIADPRARKLSFTGSTEVGRRLIAQAGDQVLRVSMELGGNAPFLVFADADVDAAVEGALVAKMRNIGESCIAANRFLVHRDLADRFAARLAERMGALRVGPGTEPDVDAGPLIDGAAVDKVVRLVEDATDRGADILTGGKRIDGPGYFYEPTVLTGVDPDAPLVHEEIFGPVAPVVPFGDEEEAIALANATPFGLVAYAYTRDVGRALSLADRLETGMVGINRGLISDPAGPFGGVKHSGLGKEGGGQGIAEYLDWRYVALEA